MSLRLLSFSELAAGYGWADVVGFPDTRFAGGTVPTVSQINTTGFYGMGFAIGDDIWFLYHLPHDYVPGSPVYPHVHWMADGTDARTVKWQVKLVHAQGHNQQAFDLDNPTIINLEQASPAQYQHMVTEVDDSSAFDAVGLEPDSIVWCHVTRVTNGDAGGDNADGIYMLFSDIHYRSNGRPTRNKSPNFYEE